ncbi:unnamed protein product, partial [Polarella glacialis]
RRADLAELRWRRGGSVSAASAQDPTKDDSESCGPSNEHQISPLLGGCASGDFAGRHGHRVPWRQYLALGLWLVLLGVQYVLIRLVCQLGIPDDCDPHSDLLEVMHDLQEMFTLGFILAVLTGIHLP